MSEVRDEWVDLVAHLVGDTRIARTLVTKLYPLIRQATAHEIAAEIEAAADAHNAKIADIAGVPNRHRDGMVASGIRDAAEIARRVGGGGGGGQ
jgi:hypothetical protein